MNKGKNQRDRRKLREKRRSTGKCVCVCVLTGSVNYTFFVCLGVVHLASTESTGGSTTGDDEESSDATAAAAANPSIPGSIMCAETKRNTQLNESGSGIVGYNNNNNLNLLQERLQANGSGGINKLNGGSGLGINKSNTNGGLLTNYCLSEEEEDSGEDFHSRTGLHHHHRHLNGSLKLPGR